MPCLLLTRLASQSRLPASCFQRRACDEAVRLLTLDLTRQQSVEVRNRLQQSRLLLNQAAFLSAIDVGYHGVQCVTCRPMLSVMMFTAPTHCAPCAWKFKQRVRDCHLRMRPVVADTPICFPLIEAGQHDTYKTILSAGTLEATSPDAEVRSAVQARRTWICAR